MKINLKIAVSLDARRKSSAAFGGKGVNTSKARAL
jgi:hypothetical protein